MSTSWHYDLLLPDAAIEGMQATVKRLDDVTPKIDQYMQQAAQEIGQRVNKALDEYQGQSPIRGVTDKPTKAKADELEPPKGNELPSGQNKLLAAEKLEIQASDYASLINSNKPWSWKDFPEGDKLTIKEKRAIKQKAIDKGLVPNVSFKSGTKYPDFASAGLIKAKLELPEGLWKKSDYIQFKWLDEKLPVGMRDGNTWHHSEIPGVMELVPFGPHNMINHQGGRSKGHWAYSKR
ncbi:HNH endonuclease [Pseudoalteromonas sp. A22]|uniref:HNH endonuclease signature motif containing protein n=1 Tax=Pseudoalteromonas TaxID=53246 RepID=UPI001BA687D1|nr:MULTISPECIES: HNH endonuclease [Pseudoalteromonas]QUI61779.1 HNH endonuclease [Pseudoalteromonas sp. A22]USE71748.1 hypothetical protein CTT31_21970 [Pseudoalteromonas flavipulchra]